MVREAMHVVSNQSTDSYLVALHIWLNICTYYVVLLVPFCTTRLPIFMLLAGFSYLKKETFDNGMKNMHGENWQEEHPEFNGSVIYETTGRMPHGRLRIADEAFTKIDKSIIKATKIRVSQQEQSAREQERLQTENQHLRKENKELRGVAQVVQVSFTTVVNRSIKKGDCANCVYL